MIPAPHPAPQAFAKPSGIPTGPVIFPQPCCSPSIQSNSKNLVRNKPSHPSRLRAELLESSTAEKDLGVVVDKELSKSQQCVFVAKEANGCLGCLRKSFANLRGRGSPRGAHLELCVPCWVPQYKRNVELLGQAQLRNYKDDQRPGASLW